MARAPDRRGAPRGLLPTMTIAGEARATVATELRAIDRRVPFGALVVCLAAAAWLVLWAWSASPYARYLGHGGWADPGIVSQLCSALPGGEILVPALAYAAGWLLMIAAMMLPTTLPLLEIFRRITAGRADASRLIALVALGYACAWLGFGLVAHAADAMVHAVVARIDWLAVNGWAIGAAVLGGAGLFQFTELKYRCLDRCRTPLGFVVERWHGGSPAREAFALGVAHGVFCVGCCWALMLITFAVGSGSVGWMLALSAIMAVEKNHPAGRRISAPLGAALLVWSSLLVLLNAGALAR